jgi:hypothetical protein
MHIYNVTINIDDSVHDEWKNWMQSIHIPEVLSTGLFLESRFARVLIDEESGTTYSIQYLFNELADYQLYEQLYAEDLRNKTEKLFGGQFVAFRTMLDIIDINKK